MFGKLVNLVASLFDTKSNYIYIVTDIVNRRPVCRLRYSKKRNIFENIYPSPYGDLFSETEFIHNIVKYQDKWFLNKELVKEYIEAKKDSNYIVNVTEYKGEEND